MADVASTLALWSSTTASNTPADSTSIGSGLATNLRELQGVVTRGLSHKGADIASAATTDLGAVEGLAHDITGTVTITSFGTGREGLLKLIQFDGILTLTHNATSLVLPGGANILTAAGDVAVMFSEGSGNWRCYSYVVAANAPGTPIGSVIPYTGTAAPGGWLLCYGQAVSRTTYAALFAVTSTTYGVGDGATTFNVPDLRGRVVAGQDDMGGTSANRLTGVTGSVDGDVLGGTGGEETHTLITAEMPAHTHAIKCHAGANDGGATIPESVAASNNDNPSTDSAGGGGAHNNVQPTLILNYIVKT